MQQSVSAEALGRAAVAIAKELWPELDEIKNRLLDQGEGWDARLYGRSIQLKGDQRMASSRNFYHEDYKKTFDNPSQEWRKSPGYVQDYIIVTDGYAVKTSLDLIVSCQLKYGRFRQILSTSVGWLIPLDLMHTESLTFPDPSKAFSAIRHQYRLAVRASRPSANAGA